MPSEETERASPWAHESGHAVLAASKPAPPYDDLFHISPVGFCTIDVTGYPVEFNRLACGWFGIPSKQPAGQPLAEYVLPDDRPMFDRYFQQLRQSSDPLACDLRMVRHDGTAFWACLTGNRLVSRSGPVTFCLAVTDISNRKQQELELRKHDERFQHVIEATRDGIWDWNIPTGEVYFSPQWARLLGYEPEEVPGRVEFFLSLLHPDDVARISKVLNDHLAGLTPIKKDEIRLRMKSGEFRWFFDRGRVVAWDKQSKPIRMVGTITDITARKEAEAALEESRKRKQLLMTAASLGLWDWDLLTDEVYFSPEWKQQLGYEDDELPSEFEQWKSRVHESDIDHILTAVRDFCDGRRPVYDVEFRMRHRNGSWRWIFARADLARNENGEPVRMMGCHFDITERKQAEASLLESEARLRDAQAISQIGNFHWSARTDLVTWSDELYRLYGHRRGEFEPGFESYIAAVHEDDRPRVVQTLQEAIETRSRFEHQYRIVRCGGEIRWVHARGVALLDRNGQLAGMEGTCQDITDQKQAEAAHASLEAQLRESQKMEAIGTLAGGIAHDFNNILAAILGNVEIVAQEVPDASPIALKSLEDIGRAGSRARDLVQQILSFSRRQPTDRKPICLEPIIEESARLLRATLPARIALQVHCRPDVPPVLADATQIEQVLLNLATNAMQAMRSQPGQITIELDTVHLDTPLAEAHPTLHQLFEQNAGEVVCLRVTDNGPGMDAATRQRIFEPFFTTKPIDQGTGLGLSVVHGIVQSHDGAILVSSQPGAGASFSIYLPATGQPGKELESREQVCEAPHAGSDRSKHILYLDDDTSVLILVKRLLERRGDRVTCFVDQQEALAALQSNPDAFDAVVTDYNMPGMQGLEVARLVRAIRPDLPVAVMSGFIDEELQAGADECGVRLLIAKPFGIDEFYQAIQQLSQSSQREN